MSVKVNVDMKEEYMVEFLLHHTYTHYSGIIGLIVGVLATAMGISTIMQGEFQAAWPMFLIAVLFLIVTPATTVKKAKQQVRNSEMFKNTIQYEFSETGVTASQGKTKAVNEWSEFIKVIETKKSVILYVSRLRAIIFPKACMGDKYADVVKIIRANMPESAKVKIRG